MNAPKSCCRFLAVPHALSWLSANAGQAKKYGQVKIPDAVPIQGDYDRLIFFQPGLKRH